MKLFTLAALSLLTTPLVHASPLSSVASFFAKEKRWPTKPAPKFFIISMFGPEQNAWLNIPEFNVFAKNVTFPGLSPIYPNVHCTSDYEICQITVGEAEINAASSISALVYAGPFNLTSTYFMIAGIAGINPEVGTLGSVTFAKYAVQTALMYEIDAREIPSNWSTGYFPFGTTGPFQYPKELYGTEVFKVNDALQEIAIEYASAAKLNDSTVSQAYRAHYAANASWAAAAAPPKVIAADVVTSDVWYSGELLSSTVETYANIITNGSFHYGTTAEEDNATLEVLLRAAKAGLVDFGRIIVMRTASDIDRPYPGETAVANLLGNAGGFGPSIENIYLAGVKVVTGIVGNWDSKFKAGIKPNSYIGDIFGSLGPKPDFGPYTAGGSPLPTKRSVKSKRRR